MAWNVNSLPYEEAKLLSICFRCTSASVCFKPDTNIKVGQPFRPVTFCSGFHKTHTITKMEITHVALMEDGTVESGINILEQLDNIGESEYYG